MEIEEQEIASRGIRFSCVEDGNEVGRAFLYILQNDLHDVPFGLMEDVFIDELQRGKGIGTQLVKRLTKKQKKRNAISLLLRAGMNDLRSMNCMKIWDSKAMEWSSGLLIEAEFTCF